MAYETISRLYRSASRLVNVKDNLDLLVPPPIKPKPGLDYQKLDRQHEGARPQKTEPLQGRAPKATQQPKQKGMKEP
ncbi:hypothetical protein SAY86_000807 [Trapa natans]|uniref:Uncharacterized protein n=1 Tax=Trapa natans TaxID=22666 RepID=A0AAN7MCL2_TRANT|nr:hypothetical protein SAY86_000807 [Trapa natans]